MAIADPPYEFEKREDLKLTDKGYPEVFIRMISMMNEEDPLFIMGGGDYVLRRMEEDFQTFLDIADAFKSPVFYVAVTMTILSTTRSIWENVCTPSATEILYL